MMNIAAVAIGGAAGSVARYGLQQWWNISFPFGTLAVNIIGCFAVGCLWAMSIKGFGENARLLLMVGFCGGFTTFSAFSLEGVQLLMSDRWAAFSFYIVASITVGLLATFLGYKIFS